MNNLLNVVQAATYLGMSKAFLDKSRLRGDGPVFVKAKRSVRYRQEDLDSWVVHRLRTSTSALA